ncbi:hypothetical protein COJ01_17570 [Priestia megaterium]|uniref:hypothetical protein n=1 Tax=Priestia megaterium TaxID=1404 RepID=UPI000BFA4FF4|nr:hypothetical protein [Priestia megaterium]PFK99872.1 hypothetical protein COJ01_17570 [Priestia megaterium]
MAMVKSNVYSIFCESRFKEFMCESTHSIYECSVNSKFSPKHENVTIIKLAEEGAKIIPFIVMSYHRDVYKVDNFGQMYNVDVTAVYLVDEEIMIFKSSYDSKYFDGLTSTIKIFTGDQLREEMQKHFLVGLKQSIILSKELGIDDKEKEEYPYHESSVADWYIKGLSPIDYVVRNTDCIRPIENKILAYMIRYVRGEDIMQDALEHLSADSRASILVHVEQKFKEYDKSEEMQRNVELYKIIKSELKNAVTINVIKKDGSQMKVENRITNDRGIFRIGDYSRNVQFSDIDYLMYKKKVYGKTKVV